MVRIVLCIFASDLQNHFCLSLVSECKSYERSTNDCSATRQDNGRKKLPVERLGGNSGPDRKFANHQAVPPSPGSLLARLPEGGKVS